MPLTGSHTFVGFGFGAIQAGLFLYEALHSGAFGKLVVAEVVPEVVESIREADGYYMVNIARKDHLEQERIGPIQIENPAHKPDRERLIEAVAVAHEIGTAVPDVSYYATGQTSSIHRILAEGIRQKIANRQSRTVIYTAENHNRAASILHEKIWQELPEEARQIADQHVKIVDTVIGKMSGVVTDPEAIRSQNLATVVPGEQRAFLVEAFNQILISQAAFNLKAGEPAFRRGISVFQEKPDLQPFEEAKLFGHNATHALAAYIGAQYSITYLQDLRDIPGAMAFLRKAFIEESGAALIRKHSGADPLFTPAGFAAYVDDLLERMVNPYLRDTIARVGRDPKRKLGWNDRLVGVMRLALREGIQPVRYAFGAAAALALLEPAVLEKNLSIRALLTQIWEKDSPDPAEADPVIRQIEAGVQRLSSWKQAGFPDLTRFDDL